MRANRSSPSLVSPIRKRGLSSVALCECQKSQLERRRRWRLKKIPPSQQFLLSFSPLKPYSIHLQSIAINPTHHHHHHLLIRSSSPPDLRLLSLSLFQFWYSVVTDHRLCSAHAPEDKLWFRTKAIAIGMGLLLTANLSLLWLPKGFGEWGWGWNLLENHLLSQVHSLNPLIGGFSIHIHTHIFCIVITVGVYIYLSIYL